MSHKALDVAHYIILIQSKNKFLNNSERNHQNELSHLKLQKLLYYAQGSHLALYDSPLFEEQTEAWGHGPVVRAVYIEYKSQGRRSLSPPTVSADFMQTFSSSTERLLHTVDAKYGQFSAWQLREMTHQEMPWVVAYKEGMKNPINIEAMRDYFKKRRQAVLDKAPILRLDAIMREHELLFHSLADA